MYGGDLYTDGKIIGVKCPNHYLDSIDVVTLRIQGLYRRQTVVGGVDVFRSYENTLLPIPVYKYHDPNCVIIFLL